MNKKNCELCDKKRAIMYCESDQANLCWDCDSKVHSANFLVAKHSRNLLCNSCQNQTPWTASGPNLSPTFSLCNSCLQNPNSALRLRDPIGEIGDSGERVEENYQTETDNHEDEDEYESSDSEIDDDDDDGNQVVPLSSSPSSTFFPPSPARSVSSSGSFGDLSAAGDGGGGGATAAAVTSSPWKRVRESDCLHSEDEETCSSSIEFLRPMKVLRTNELCE